MVTTRQAQRLMTRKAPTRSLTGNIDETISRRASNGMICDAGLSIVEGDVDRVPVILHVLMVSLGGSKGKLI